MLAHKLVRGDAVEITKSFISSSELVGTLYAPHDDWMKL